jgi:hypothetical protein
MGRISDLHADLLAGVYDDDPGFLEAVGWDESDILHQEGVDHDVRQPPPEPPAASRDGTAAPFQGDEVDAADAGLDAREVARPEEHESSP